MQKAAESTCIARPYCHRHSVTDYRSATAAGEEDGGEEEVEKDEDYEVHDQDGD